MKTLIKNGCIIDGTGKKSFQGSILIDNEKIIDVFAENETPEIHDAEIFDATNYIISPGFIDSHAHSDAYLILEPNAPSKITQGITTEINGQCGGSIAPRFGEARLSSDWATLLGDRLSWHTLKEYRNVLESIKPAINTVQFVGHNTLRASTIGYAGREATSDELKKMSRLLEEALEEGAWGLTTGLIYQPGKYANYNEVMSLAKITASKGGLYATHMKSEGDALLESIDEVITLAKETGIKVEISHLKTSGKQNWHKIGSAISKIENAMKEEYLLGADRYPFCAAGTDLDVVFPDWAGEGGTPVECNRLQDKNARQKIINELNVSSRDWSTVMIGGVWSEENREFSGKTISQILQSHNLTPGELICNILEKDGCKTGAFFFTMNEENLDTILSQPWIVPGSDASLRAPWGPLGNDHPHPRAYGTMPEFYRRLRTLGISQENAIARMTSIPARRFGLKNRGEIKKGFIADVIVWDEKPFVNNATYAIPHQFATGIKSVWVNGTLTLANNKPTENRSGKMLTK